MSDIYSSSVFSRRIYESLVNIRATEKHAEILRKLRKPVIHYIDAIIGTPDKEYEELVSLFYNLELSEYQVGIIAGVFRGGLLQSICDEQISDEILLNNFYKILNLKFCEDQTEILYSPVFRYVKASTSDTHKEYKELLKALLNSGLNKDEAGLIVGHISSELFIFLYYIMKGDK